YLFNPKNTEFYKLTYPYTELSYFMGAKKEQLFRVKFNRKLFPNFAVGASIRFINSPGYYERQKSDDKSFNLTAQYFTSNKRYGIIGTYIHNKVYVEENGGIQNDSTFEKNIEKDRKIFPINLNDAKNELKNNTYFFNQYFNLSRRSDSTSSASKLGRITHSFTRSKETVKYIDNEPTAGFYKNVFLDTIQTFDSVYQYKIENSLTWSNLGYNDTALQKPVYVYFGAKHSYIELAGYMPRLTIRQISPNAGIYLRLLKNSILFARYSYTTGDYNDGDFTGDVMVSHNFKYDSLDLGKLTFSFITTKHSPAYFYQHYESNNFMWRNDFVKIRSRILGAEYQYKRLTVSANFTSVKNYVYLNENALPQQSTGVVNVIRGAIDYNLRFWKMGVDSKVVYQSVSDKNVLRVPPLMVNLSIYFNSKIFQDAATIQPGIDIFYNNKYYADAYMPALRSFYLQNTKEIGNYYYIDLYIMLRIRRAIIFLKYRHLNALFGNYTYYMVPHYPQQDAAFKLGISWKFFD
ncbi:putative porin, partial [Bacteroidota bacterium]